MKEIENHTRRELLKKMLVAAMSIGAFSYITVKKPKGKRKDFNITSLSKEEANEIIQREKFPVSEKIKPAPSPNRGDDV